MRFEELNLAAFGHFTDHRICFPENPSDFHIIYGLNEAGKSTTLRAITDFLFGFKPDSKDNFLHENNRLRVGARIAYRDGHRSELMRRKGRLKTLHSWTDDTPIDDPLLTKSLESIDRELFQTMFGIDHHRLRAGGDELMKAGGKLARSFSHPVPG